MRTLLLGVAGALVVSCVSTTLETPSNHPANPPAAAAPSSNPAAPLASGFDPFEAYANDVGGPGAGKTENHAGHGAPGGSPSAGVDHGAHSQPVDQKPPEGAPAKPLFTCPMHPDVLRDAPGKCPTCGMQLVPKKPEPDHSSH